MSVGLKVSTCANRCSLDILVTFVRFLDRYQEKLMSVTFPQSGAWGQWDSHVRNWGSIEKESRGFFLRDVKLIPVGNLSVHSSRWVFEQFYKERTKQSVPKQTCITIYISDATYFIKGSSTIYIRRFERKGWLEDLKKNFYYPEQNLNVLRIFF